MFIYKTNILIYFLFYSFFFFCQHILVNWLNFFLFSTMNQSKNPHPPLHSMNPPYRISHVTKKLNKFLLHHKIKSWPPSKKELSKNKQFQDNKSLLALELFISRQPLLCKCISKITQHEPDQEGNRDSPSETAFAPAYIHNIIYTGWWWYWVPASVSWS